MFVKSVVLTSVLSVLVVSSSHAEIKNLHERILTEYDIHPPALKYGYPLWYQYDSLPITGIIFLKNGLDDLYREDKITYVAEPTKENAEIILNFSGKVGAYPKFYIVPDSNLTWREVDAFMQFLTPDYWESHFLLCDANNTFVNYTIKESSVYPGATMGCGPRGECVVMNNCRGDLLLEGEFLERDSLSFTIYRYYWSNYFFETDYNSFYRICLTKEICEHEIKRLTHYASELDSSENERGIYEEEILKYKRFIYLIESCADLSLISRSAYFDVKFQNCDRAVPVFYKYLDLINRGVYLSREKRAVVLGNGSYESLFRYKKMDDVEYIHTEFPDLLIEEYYNEELGYWENLDFHPLSDY